MTFRPFPKDRTVTGAQARLQDGTEASIRGTFASLGGTPAQGKLVEKIDVPASPTTKKFYHHLGRRYTGFIVVEDHTGVAWVKNTRADDDDKAVTLAAHAAATVSIWVF